MIIEELDERTTGGVYLCRAENGVTCAACCGVYNWPWKSDMPAILERELRWRAEAIDAVPRSVEALDGFADTIIRRQPGTPPLDDFHHCPYVGQTNADERSGDLCPGCLIHPLSRDSGGMDFRGLSHYGLLACRDYFCPTHQQVAAPIKRVIRRALGASRNWYLYGLIIPDAPFINALFDHIHRFTGRSLDLSDMADNPAAESAMADLLNIRLAFTPPDRPVIPYFFNDRLHKKPAPVYGGGATAGASHAAIFDQCGCVFENQAAVDAAGETIDALARRLARAVSPGGTSGHEPSAGLS